MTLFFNSTTIMRPRWPSGKVSTSGLDGRRLDSMYGARCTLNHTSWPNALPLVWRGSLEVPCQVSSSSSDRCSKLRGPSLNSPRVASKGDDNLT
ncbi:hypothetical protein AVEN_22581-1 [Araneus ventricosus]|uniref:Uncharacterized protein n=1 Tax=Araneus ventricosus TaxID=182803 RepID=A0A4Y2E5R7_ARAVE|nr:hypothetical protein AVEN_22581-1 [Araneus ventricosus]